MANIRISALEIPDGFAKSTKTTQLEFLRTLIENISPANDEQEYTEIQSDQSTDSPNMPAEQEEQEI